MPVKSRLAYQIPTKAEAQAAKDHYEFMTESSKSLAEKTEAEKQALKLLNDAKAKYSTASDQMEEQMALVQGEKGPAHLTPPFVGVIGTC